MAWRFSPSKYKNTAPKLQKKDATIYDLPIGTLSCTNNAIHSNSKLLAFLIDGEGGKIAVLPAGATGRRLRSDMSILCAHGDSINDFCFLKFDNFIATCAGSGEKLKIWSCDMLGDPNVVSVTSDARSTIDVGKSDIRTILDCLSPHKTAGNLLAVGLATAAPAIVDLNAEKAVIDLNAELDRSLSLDWSEDGSLLIVSSDKGKSAMIFDPRAKAAPIENIVLHAGIGRENRVVFANNALVSSGFTTNRAQEVLLYDSRNWSKPIQNEVFEGSTGLLIPLYDSDSKLLFLTGKGACKFFLTELKHSDKSSSITRLHEQSLTEQTLGACLLPKVSCDVMSGEVQRVYQLTKSSIVPIPCIVPRRSYQQFHEDLFPDTIGELAGCNVEEWLNGSKELPKKVKLGPVVSTSNGIANGTLKDELEQNKPSVHYQDVFVRKTDEALPANNGKLSALEDSSDKENCKKNNIGSIDDVKTDKEHSGMSAEPIAPITVRLRQNANVANADSTKLVINGGGNEGLKSISSSRARPKSCVVGTIQSKFRHVEVVAGANKNIFSNLRNVNNRLPTESNGFCVSLKYAAIPLSGSAGIVAVFELSSYIKVPDGLIDGLQNRSQLMDLQWNPFRVDELAVGLDNGTINIWRIDQNIPCIGSEEFNEILKRQKEEDKSNAPLIEYPKLTSLEPFKCLITGQRVRITHLRYHSTVSNLLAVGLLNGVIQLWNIETEKCLLEIQGHSQGILSLAWSSNGQKLASVGRDSMLKVYEPLLGQNCCLAEEKVLESTRAARILFVCEDSLILLVGFSRSSNRQCKLYRADNLQALHSESIDVSTQPLVPYYDYDTSVVFLTGKGDRTIQMFEVCADAPHFLRLAPTTFSSGHQAIALFQKNVCDVADVEFASGCRLTEKNLEKLSFKVPRVKKELFQRDVFPNALMNWEPTCSAADWQNGVLNSIKFFDLRPNGMQENMASVPNSARYKPQSNVESKSNGEHKYTNDESEKLSDRSVDDLQKRTELGWSAKIPKFDGRLEQDEREGVDESEWATTETN